MSLPRGLCGAPPGAAILPALAADCVAIARDDPLAPTRIRLFLPTRRACRGFEAALAEAGAGRALFSPRTAPIGDLASEAEDEDAWDAPSDGEADGPLTAPAPAPALLRRLTLARLAMAQPRPDESRLSPGAALPLAVALEGLLDEAQIAGIDLDALETLDVEDAADHWRRSLTFLKILFTEWPKIRDAMGVCDPAQRRDRALRALAARWTADPPAERLIAAGTTGSHPAVAQALRAILATSDGAVLLPGFDFGLDADGWAAVAAAPTHPQHGLARLLAALGAEPGDVQPWPADAPTPARAALLRAALAPIGGPPPPLAAATATAALDGLHILACADPQAEAETAAMLLRETLESKTATAALVTPDRDLARRTAAALRRWAIRIDDSAGRPLAATPAAAVLRLGAAAVAEQAAPAALLAWLGHPCATAVPAALMAGLDDALRGLRPPPGLDGVAQRIAAAVDAARIDADATQAWAVLAAKLRPAFGAQDRALLDALVAACEALAGGADRLFAGAEGDAVADFLADLAPHLDGLTLTSQSFPAFLDATMAGRAVRDGAATHPRLQILGPLEARMTGFDRLILGGLNEDIWPKPPAPDPWLSRGMRAQLGLDSPEMRIGRQAHDVQQLVCGAAEVYLLRPARSGGAETTPARWLSRLDAALARAGVATPRPAPARDPRRWATALHAPTEADRSPAPADAARPPVAARPKRLSISDVEQLLRTPYAFYARRVLGLRARDPLDQDPGAAERGSALHALVERFVAAHPTGWPADAAAEMAAIRADIFAALAHEPATRALWRPRVERIAAAFLVVEQARRDGLERAAVEVRAQAAFGDLLLAGKVDRVDRFAGGALTLIDYKSGATPTKEEVVRGLRPQLALEAAMALAGAFGPLSDEPDIAYWPLTGKPGDDRPKPAAADVAAVRADAEAALARIAARFADPQWGFALSPHPQAAQDPGWAEYAPLAGAPPPERRV